MSVHLSNTADQVDQALTSLDASDHDLTVARSVR